jgi:hypothetical protein
MLFPIQEGKVYISLNSSTNMGDTALQKYIEGLYISDGRLSM